MTRRFFLGFASMQPCNPGEVITVQTRLDWPRAARIGRLAFSPSSMQFDFLQWHIGEKAQCPRSHVPGSLFVGNEGFLDGDTIRPNDVVSMTVVNRGNSGIYFGAALHVEELEPEEQPAQQPQSAAPNGAPPPPQAPPGPQAPPAAPGSNPGAS